MKKYLLAIDSGTTSVRAIVFDKQGKIISLARRPINQFYPAPDYVEQDPREIFEKQYECILEAVRQAGISPEEILSAGITNQRETTVVWNKNTGEPVYNAIVWQDRRTKDYCEKLKDEHGTFIQEKTGLIPDPYFSATKIKWILEHIHESPEVLLFGTIDTWLLWNFTRGKVHATDFSNASRTMLLNIDTGIWDKDLLKLFGVPEHILPEVKAGNAYFGDLNIEGEKIPVKAVLGDQQSALFGQQAFATGETKVTYGTGAFLLMNIGTEKVLSKNGMLTTIAWKLEGEEIVYALEGASFTAGAAIEWLKKIGMLVEEKEIPEEIRKKLELYSVRELSEIFEKTKPETEVFLVPAFSGLGAPYWNPYAKGIITGLTLATTKTDLLRAAVEAMAYQTDELLQCFAEDFGKFPALLKADGGASQNDYLMQFQADLSGVKVLRPVNIETTAWGVAMLSGNLEYEYSASKEFLSGWDNLTRARKRKAWKKAVKKSFTD